MRNTTVTAMNDSRPPRVLTGRAVLIWLVAFFAVVFGVNGLMMTLALKTMPGTEVDSSYQAGNAFNAETAAARLQAERNWQVIAHVEPSPAEARQPVQFRGRVGRIEGEPGESHQRELRRRGVDMPDRRAAAQERLGDRRRQPARGDVGHQPHVIHRRDRPTPGHDHIHPLVLGPWSLVLGHRSLVLETESLVIGPWTVVG